ncbi:MAG: hypothetical protein PWP31_258 [Clostridia bacterium]|nr:hypothetical protein [Clostridia bacterium]
MVGVADAESLSEAPEGHRPIDYLPEVRSVNFFCRCS